MATNEATQDDVNHFADSYTGYELTSAAIACLFITWVLLDVWKAFRRKAHWIPGQALVLSAISVLLVNFLDHLDVSINSKNSNLVDLQLILLVEEQLVIDSRRLMICVFIAYLLPGIVSTDLKTVWVQLGALAFTVISHMAFQAYFIFSTGSDLVDLWNQWKPYRGWLIPSYIAITLAIMLLFVLLSCAVIAGESIRKMMSQRVPLALSYCCCNSVEYKKCKNIEDHILKSWVVVRASQPDYVMARSVFSAFAGVVVTICIVLFALKWKYVPLPDYYFDKTVCAAEFAFVVVGSIVVVFRWLTAVFYFPKDVRCLFSFEDFWTRSLVHRRGSRLCMSSLTMLLLLQKLMVLLCKLSWFLSEGVFIVIRPFAVSKDKSDEFSKYEEVLEIMRMPGENADSLWRANKSAFLNAHNLFQKGMLQNGKDSSKKLIKLIEHMKIGIPEDEAPTSLEEENHFMEVGKMSWKMRAVSLIRFIIYFYDGTDVDVVNDDIQAFREVVRFMDMVDSSDPEAELVNQAADKEFNTLETVWKNHLKIKRKESNGPHNQCMQAKSMRLLQQKIKDPLKMKMEQLSRTEREQLLRKEQREFHDSIDLMTVAANISSYKVWKAFDLNFNPANAIYNLRCALANIFYHCLYEELDKALRENCNKWAKDGKETEILKAALIAGKAKGVRQQINQGQDRLQVQV